MAKTQNTTVEYGNSPNWPTSLRGVSRDGRLMGIDNSVWIIRSVPMSPIADAKDSSKKLLGGSPIMEAFHNLSELATNRLGRRSSSRSTYRQFHLLTVDMPRYFRAPANHPLHRTYNDAFGSRVSKRRLCLMAVKLQDSLGSGGWKSAVDSIVNTAVFAEPAQLSDYDKDAEVVASCLDRAGLKETTTEEILLADAWWNRGDRSDTPFIPHTDHMHVFPTNDSLRVIEDGHDHGELSKKDCKTWPENFGAHSITFAAMRGLDLESAGEMSVVDQHGAWVYDLIEAGAMAVSLRGLVEPSRITRSELRRNRKSYIADIEERQRENKMSRAEQEERLGELSNMEDAYSSKNAPASLIDTSIVVAINGRPNNTVKIGGDSLAVLDSMDDRQLRAWSEMTLCSAQRSNPNLQDLPSSAVAYSGVNGLSIVGDPAKMETTDLDEQGNETGRNISVPSMLAGFTEKDGQPSWLAGTAASGVDKEPIAFVAGTTGSGKSLPLSTLLPTPTGFIRLGEVVPGTRLLGRKGKPVTVTSLSPIFDDKAVYRMSVSDGRQVDCDGKHQWVVSPLEPGRLGAAFDDQMRLDVSADVLALDRLSNEVHESDPDKVSSAIDIFDLITSRDLLRHGRWTCPEAIDAALSVMDAPVLASSSHAKFYSLHAALRLLSIRLHQQYAKTTDVCEYRMTTDEIRASGQPYAVRVAEALDLPAADLGEDPYLIGTQFARRNFNARLPMEVLRSSIDQRRGVLSGIISEIGVRTESGDYSVSHPEQDALSDIAHLVRSLGVRATLTPDNDMVVFGDPVKPREEDQFAVIVDFEKIASVPVRCLSVDDDDATYLVGEELLPTSNTQALLWWAYQGAQMGQPQVILDPKPGSDHTEAIKGPNTLIASLDELSQSDGIFDPLRFAANPQAGIDMATSLLTQVNPWGEERENYSTSLAKALHVGVKSGARCIGQALMMARSAERINKTMIDQVFDLAEASPMFRACVGMDNDAQSIRVSNGITYIKVGDANLELPTPGQDQFSMTPTQRASLALVRMMIFGSSMALTGRNGVLHADEAWTFLKAGPEEVERLGRLARSQGVLPILYSQKVSDATDKALQNYISRGFILGIKDQGEAHAACELFGLEPTDERIERITSGSTKGGTVGEEGEEPNWNSLRPLRKGYGGKVLRGSVAIYSDLSGDRANTIEIPIPAWFFEKSSTNTVDQEMRRRKAASRDAA